MSTLEFILLYIFGLFCIFTMLFVIGMIYMCFPGGGKCGEKINGEVQERVQKMEM